MPATPAGIPPIRRLTGRGLNINITLLFSVDVYEQVVEAYISGLEDLARAGGDISRIASVASIFVNRTDTAIDKRLDKLGDKRAAGLLRGKVGIANAQVAYARYKALFAAPRWQLLAASGAQTQRLLWASTGVKDPAYKDTMYVEALIGRDTVDTVAHCGDPLRPRQGDDRCLAGDRRSRHLAGAASGGEHGQARARVDSAGRGAACRTRVLRERRFFACLELDGQVDPLQREAVAALERAGHPVTRIRVQDIWHIAP